jgi:hypothetical protein
MVETVRRYLPKEISEAWTRKNAAKLKVKKRLDWV